MSRRAERNAGGTKISVNDVIIQATAQCLREYPNLNSHVSQSSLTVKSNINVGMAVSVDEGLMVPVLGNADGLSLAEIADQSREAANNARRGIIKPASPGTLPFPTSACSVLRCSQSSTRRKRPFLELETFVRNPRLLALALPFAA